MFGHGTFVYQPEAAIDAFGDANAAADAMINHGMSHAWLRVHNKNGPWQTSLNETLADACKSRGISVGIWGWNDGNDVEQDIENALFAIKHYRPDAYVADIEHGVSGANWSVGKAKLFTSEVKNNLGTTPLVVSTFGYIPYHQPEIMTAVDEIVDFFAPQVYWFWYPRTNMLQDPALSDLKENNAAAYAKVCLHEWRKVVSKPLVLTGQAYWGEASGWTQSRAETKLKEFIDGFDDYDKLAGLNWWNFADQKAMSTKMRKMISAANFPTKFGASAQASTISNQSPPNFTSTAASNDRIVAAEGLFFRSAPTKDPSNIIAELDYGVPVQTSGSSTSNGYVASIITMNGTTVSGYLHTRYLRPVEHPMIERAVKEAVGEWHRFLKGGGIEDKEPFSGFINEMWSAVGRPDLSGKDTDQPWSAAFISFVLDNAEYKRTTFDIRHSTYIHESIQNRITGTDSDFWGYRVTEAKPQVGDLVCQWRVTETTYDEAETQSRFSSHTDLVIAVRENAIVTMGGNVTNDTSGVRGVTVGTKTYPLNSDGFLPGTRNVFALMKNMHRPTAERLIT